MSPTVSAILPVYNGTAFVAQALRSIREQTHLISEVIVVDDGSTDNLAAVLAEFGDVRCVSQKNGGAATARNRGAALASGDFLAFLDADDLWQPEKTAHQLAGFAADESLEAIFGHTEQFAEPGHSVSAAHQIVPAELPSAMLIRRASFTRVGGYPESLRIGEVIAWMATARARGLRSQILSEVVYRRRVHGRNTTLQSMARPQYLSAVRAAIAVKNLPPSRSGGSS